jgi:hypothetical protein
VRHVHVAWSASVPVRRRPDRSERRPGARPDFKIAPWRSISPTDPTSATKSAKSSPWQQLSLLVRAHDLDRLVVGQSRVQELLDGPSLLLDEVCDQQAISRIGTLCLHHEYVDWTVSKCVSQLLERLPVLDPHIVGEAFPDPLRQAKKTGHADRQVCAVAS